MKHLLLSLLLILPFLSRALQAVDGYGVAMEDGFSHFSTRDGMPNSFTNQVCQDERGYMWLSSIYGLYRYDGYDVKPFKNSSRHPFFLPSNTVISLAADGRGHLWIGTQEGPCRMNLGNGSMRHYGLPDVDHQRVNSIRITRNGRIYVGTMRGLFRYDAQHDTLLAVSALGTVNVQTILEDGRGELLVGTWEDGLLRYRPDNGSVRSYASLADTQGVFAICRRQDGSVLLGTRSGLVEVSFAHDGTVARSATLDRSRPVYSLAAVKDASGGEHVYVGCRNGLYMLTPSRTLVPTGVPTMIRHIYADRHGMLWFSSQGDGLFTWSATKRDFFSTRYDKFIQSVFATRKGDMFTSFDEGADYNGTMLLPGLHVRTVTARRDTSLYFLSVWNDGLWTIDSRSGAKTHYTSENCGFIAGKSLHKTFEDSKGNWWTVGYAGLGVRYADGRALRFADEETVPEALKHELTDIMEDRDGSLWVMTKDRGLVHMSGSLLNPRHIKYAEYTAQNGKLPVNTPLCMYLDSSGALWVGTDGAGLCQLDRMDGLFKPHQNDYHLPGDMVCSIEEDAYDHLWIGTNRGLARLTVRGSHRGKLRIFTMRDGLPDNFFEPRASYQLDGTFYFGTGRGLVTFRPEAEQAGLSPHNVAITGLRIDGKDATEWVDTILNIPALTRSFTLRFASLTYENQHQCTYTYRLVGYDDEWQTTSADHRFVTYTEIPPGRYTFELCATDGDGNWSKVLSLPVIVEPPFWRTWVAYLIYVIIAVLLLSLLVRDVRRRMMTRNRLQLRVGADGKTRVMVEHKDKDEASLRDYEAGLRPYEDGNGTVNGNKYFTFEIRDLNFTSADEAFLRQTVACVSENLSDCNFGVQQLAERLSMSRTRLLKRFRSLTGINVSGFISDMRLGAALSMMDEQRAKGNRHIADLAFRVGFNDPQYFSLCFRKKYGLTPTEYMEEQSPTV